MSEKLRVDAPSILEVQWKFIRKNEKQMFAPNKGKTLDGIIVSTCASCLEQRVLRDK